jgi:hypothetical protein
MRLIGTMLLVGGCAAQDTITLPRTQTAYLLGSLEPEIRAACRAGTLQVTACAQLREAADTLKTQLFAPPQSRADGQLVLQLLTGLVGVRTGQESVRR